METGSFDAEIRSYYSTCRNAFFEELYRWVNRQALAPFFRPWLPPRRGRVLDAGSGCGHLSGEMNIGPRALHLDLSFEQLGRLKSSAPEKDCVQADVCRLPFEEGAFDAVICSNVLHYTGIAGLRELVRVTRPGGRLLVAFLERSEFTRAAGRFSVEWGLFPPAMKDARYIDLKEMEELDVEVKDGATILHVPPFFLAVRGWPRQGLVAFVLVRRGAMRVFRPL